MLVYREPFQVICADPAWRFSDRLPGKTRGADKQYPTQTVDEICALEMFWRLPIADDAWLFLWRVASMQEEALRVVRAWGFVPKTERVWEKLTKTGKPWFGMGRYLRASHETCIVAVRGRPKPLVRNIRSRFAAPIPLGPNGRPRHSAKPEVFYDDVERLARGPYVELYARRLRSGWTCIGNEV
jgi:site-specific DNA-methyltransferase (adenine-specific)